MINSQVAKLNEDSDDLFLFADEESDDEVGSSKKTGWKLLIVDDDEAIHASTRFVLADYEYDGMAVELLHAYSSKQAKELLSEHDDIALMLLDVVMETDNAGLELVGYVREELKNTSVRIILRTGQAGMAPEWEVINKYDINDYKTKTELTQERLFTTVTTALRSYEQLSFISSSTLSLEQMLEGAPKLFSIRQPDEFADYVLSQFEAIVGHISGGFVSLVTKDQDVDEMTIISGTGELENLTDKRLFGFASQQAQNSVVQALNKHVHSIEQDHLCFHIETARKHRMLVYLEMDTVFDEARLQLLNVFCVNVAIGLDNVDLIQDARKLAYFDQLTGLGNRSFFIEELNKIVETINEEEGDEFAVVFIDIDHFDDINDLVGQTNGDDIIRAFADRLVYTNPHSLIVARVSGDEFALVYKIKGDDATSFSEEMLLTSFEQPFHVLDYTISLRASAGICLVKSPDTSAEKLIRDSWVALRRAKEEGRATFRYHDENMDVIIRERAALISDLRRALNESELSLYYQPQYDLNTRKLTGAEALIRWIKPDGTFIPPDTFIPEAERSGLILPIGEWVLWDACKSIAKWQAKGIQPFPIAVNISMEQVQKIDLPALLREVLAKTGVDASLIKLEVTESMVMGDVEHAIKVLRELKEIGVKISIDDFGTGYSSLAYLKRLSVDQLKVDRSFVDDMTAEGGDALIAEAIITLSHSLNLSVIAEGVETEAHEIILRGFGCEEAQGYLYSRPLPEREFLAFVKAQQAKS